MNKNIPKFNWADCLRQACVLEQGAQVHVRKNREDKGSRQMW